MGYCRLRGTLSHEQAEVGGWHWLVTTGAAPVSLPSAAALGARGGEAATWGVERVPAMTEPGCCPQGRQESLSPFPLHRYTSQPVLTTCHPLPTRGTLQTPRGFRVPQHSACRGVGDGNTPRRIQ
ncbi:hypothetical protein KIL84_017429 [Mauremys mutica]|uniref:Uncharacterized protein n=1 Tax=Mauremys mutica TaxID=74926 RepID=A0A9D3X6G6_9SAUR|nr:hypothetical protein KIL84_017429 [Mauremys mutica]